MVIVETPAFTEQVIDLLPDNDYRQLQSLLAINPEIGKLIPGGGGLRKIRWAAKGHGKRGGVRIIYYWAVSQYRILMLFMYPKSEREDLTPVQIRVLRQIVEDEYP